MNSCATEEPILDADGYAVCPDCKTSIHCGTVGLANLEKNHRGKKTCQRAKEKRQKEEKAAKKPTLLSFFNRQRPVPVPSSISPSVLVQGHTLVSTRTAAPTVLSEPMVVVPQAAASPMPSTDDFLEKLLGMIKHLPETIPEATEYDKLAIFAGHPGDFDDPDLGVDDLWEGVLNKVLKSALGWGEEEVDIEAPAGVDKESATDGGSRHVGSGDHPERR